MPLSCLSPPVITAAKQFLIHCLLFTFKSPNALFRIILDRIITAALVEGFSIRCGNLKWLSFYSLRPYASYFFLKPKTILFESIQVIPNTLHKFPVMPGQGAYYIPNLFIRPTMP